MKRRVSISVDAHAAWRSSLAPTPEEAEHDDVDIHLVENPPAQRPQREVNRVLSILDQLDQEDATR